MTQLSYRLITTETRIIISPASYPHRYFCDQNDGGSVSQDIPEVTISKQELLAIARCGHAIRPLQH
ncbi:hypothetical protein ACFO72_000805 [Enterobacter roggenkampii]